VTVLPATATAEEVLALNPEGVFLSNGPGDPAATGAYAVPMIRGVLAAICRCSASALAIRCWRWRWGRARSR
jgi:carbamoylphosphate synthase small subunit